MFFLMFISSQMTGIYFANGMAREKITNMDIELTDSAYEEIGDAAKEYYFYNTDLTNYESVQLGKIAYDDDYDYQGLTEIMYGIDFSDFWTNEWTEGGLAKYTYGEIYKSDTFRAKIVAIEITYLAVSLVIITLLFFIIAVLSFYIMGGMELVSEQLNSMKRIIKKKQGTNGKPI